MESTASGGPGGAQDAPQSGAVVAVSGTGAEPSSASAPPSRYESQKRRDWNTFMQYLKNHKPPLTPARCSDAHVIEFLKYLDQFGKTKVHVSGCAYFGNPNQPAPCSCPFKQAWGSLDALIGRLRAAYEENCGREESNPFGARAVGIYLREVREGQAKARGIPYEKKKRKSVVLGGNGAGASGTSGPAEQQASAADVEEGGAAVASRRGDGGGAAFEYSVNVKARYPTMSFGGCIVYSRTYSEVEKATKQLLEIVETKKQNMDPVSLGLDIEWRPTFKSGIAQRKAAVMQICASIDQCFVMHIIHSGIPPILQSLLEDSESIKVGVCIAGDASKIMKDYNVCIKGLHDLSRFANVKLGGAPKMWSLSSLVEMLTCKQLEKPSKIRLGNWEVSELSKEQLQYAATDAFASWQLYQVLTSFPDAAKMEGTSEKVNGVQS